MLLLGNQETRTIRRRTERERRRREKVKKKITERTKISEILKDGKKYKWFSETGRRSI